MLRYKLIAKLHIQRKYSFVYVLCKNYRNLQANYKDLYASTQKNAYRNISVCVQIQPTWIRPG